MKKKLVFKGKEYPSYYQLEKVMGISRKTIQYRHEVIGLSIDEIPDYKAKPRIERFGDKRIEFVSTALSDATESNINDDELRRIIEYPRAPYFRFDSDDQEASEQEKKEYEDWVESAPEVLLKRELFLNKDDLEKLLASEQETYFFASPFHDEQKQKAEFAIKTIQDIALKREIDTE